MTDCDICFRDTRNRKRTGPNGELLCDDCRDHHHHITHQTYADALAEEEAIAAYVAESRSEP